eukprot:6192474-Pleurochrysis_carterae.AAC.2
MRAGRTHYGPVRRHCVISNDHEPGDLVLQTKGRTKSLLLSSKPNLSIVRMGSRSRTKQY